MVGPPPTINLFSLATHCIHAAILASTPIQALRRRCRTKDDGTLVTDADGAAQYIIYSELRSVHSGVRIVGEESDVEMKAEENRCLQNSRSISQPYTDNLGEDQKSHDKNDCSASEVLSKSSHEILLEQLQDIMKEHLLFADIPTETTSSTTIEPQKSQSESIDYRRVSVFVDPLDGTSSYAKGEYEVVTILIAIIIDNLPVFGVIVKPFQAGIQLETFRDTGCSVIYGGSLIGGAFTIGKDGGVMELERSHQFRLARNQHPHWNSHSSTISHPHKRQQEDENLNNDNHNYENTMQKDGSSKRCKKESLPFSTMDLSQLDQAKYNTNNYNDKDDDHYENVTENNHDHKSRVESDNITTKLNAKVESLPSSITLPSPSATHLPFNAKTPPPTPTSTSIITSQNTTTATATSSSSSFRHEHLLRAIISKSRSGGIVQKCIHELSSQNLLHPEPLYITGAGYKTMKLVIGQDNEGLWFFPKPGTSLWDVAAADALLRVMGGRISDRYGKDLDYQKGRMDAENIHGIIACIDTHLHTKCVELCLAEKWDHVQEQS